MTAQLLNNITAGINTAFYAAGALYHPTTFPSDVKEILKGRKAGDKEKILDHTFQAINTPVSTGYAATSCALSIETLLPGSIPFLHVLGIASGGLGAAMAGVTLVPESIGLARSLRLKANLDISKPEESLAWVRERYLQDEVGKAKLERRVGPRLVQEIERGTLPAVELVALLAEQNRKKTVSQSLGIVALFVSIAAFTALIVGVSMTYLLPVFGAFTALLIAKYVIDQGVFGHSGWSVDKGALVPDPVKKAVQLISCFVRGGSSVESNALSVENAVPLISKSSS